VLDLDVLLPAAVLLHTGEGTAGCCYFELLIKARAAAPLVNKNLQSLVVKLLIKLQS
jgi:hypothetical protein